MATHIDRMRSESSELAERIAALRNFRDHSEIYPTLTNQQRSLLAAQLQVMTCYKTVLDLRIENDAGQQVEE